jgi:hypothetical protein
MKTPKDYSRVAPWLLEWTPMPADTTPGWYDYPEWMRYPKRDEKHDENRCSCGCEDVVMVEHERFSRADCAECDKFRYFDRWEGTS